MKSRCVVFLLLFLSFNLFANLRTSRFYVYCNYSISLGTQKVRKVAFGLKFARTTQDELADSNGNRSFGSSRIGLETGLLLDKLDTVYFRIPYDIFNYGYRNKTGRQQTFSFGFGPGYAFSRSEGVFFLGIETAMETSSLVSSRFMRRIGIQYFWAFGDKWMNMPDNKKKLSLAGRLDQFYIDFGIYCKIGDFKESIVLSDSFNIGFFD